MRDMVSRDAANLWHPYTQMKTAPPPIPIVAGKGIYLYTADGRKILDGISSWWVNIHGHSHPKLNEALALQAGELDHVLFAGCTHRAAIELAEHLLSVLPRGIKKIFYSDNGSTSVEVAIKMALQYWKNIGSPERNLFVALNYAYHGDTVGAMSASEDSIFTRPFSNLLFDIKRAYSPYCYRCPLGQQKDNCSMNCLDDLGRILAEEGDRVAALIIEPMLQGAGGMIVWPREFLEGVSKLCKKFNTLLIADEVLTGFGRTGKMFACEHAFVEPDIICLSKALTGGYLPLGVTAATEPIYEAFLSDDRAKSFFHGHSYTANPIACAVANASLKLFEEEETLDRVAQLESSLIHLFHSLESIACTGEVRIIGGVGIVELVRERETRLAGGYLDELGPLLSREFLKRGLLLRPLGNVLYFMPPYVIKEEEVNWAVEQIAEVLSDSCVLIERDK